MKKTTPRNSEHNSGDSDEICSLQVTCTCHEPDPYLPHELWSLQKALIYTNGLFLDKSSTLNKWSAGLESRKSSLSRSTQQKLINYAINDCFVTTYFIHLITQQWTFKQLSNTNFIDLFQAPSSISTSNLLLSSTPSSKHKLSSSHKTTNVAITDINPQTFKQVMDNDLELISDDTDEEIFLAQCGKQVNPHELYEPISDDNDNFDTQPSIPDVFLVTNHVVVDDDKCDDTIHVNDNDKQPVSKKNHQRRSIEAKSRRNRKRNNVFRARRYRYSITRSIYYRFSMRYIKFILDKYKIKYIHIKIVGTLLIIGIKTDTLRHILEPQLPRDIFRRRHYYLHRLEYEQQQ